jgi:hypothetical protein
VVRLVVVVFGGAAPKKTEHQQKIKYRSAEGTKSRPR